MKQFKLKNIPAELQELPQWVMWRYEPGANGKQTKVPYQGNGAKASSTDPRTWTSYGRALSDFAKFDGIGIACASGLAGIDIDGHVVDGIPDEFAQAIIDQVNSYTEISPSGKGIRIFCWAKLPPGRRKHADVEMYDTGRYLTVTGWHVEGTPATVEHRDAELARIHLQVFGKEPEAPAAAPIVAPNNLDDQMLLEMARSASNGAKFNRLFLGDGSEYPSASEADLALCSILAFWTGCDAGRIDRLFRSSGLMRAKWDERHSGDGRTYGEMTIEKAIAGTNDVYQPYEEDLSNAPPIDEDPHVFPTFEDLQKILGPIEWEWPGWLARGFMTVCVSESGTGKSALLMRLAKTFVSGDPWPDGQPYNGAQGRVVWAEAEAAQAINLARAKSWKIPLDRLIFPLGDPMGDFRLNNPSHRGLLAEAAAQPDVVAIIIDSLSGADSRAEKSTEDAGSVFWLAALARDSNKPMLLSHHLRKRGLLDGDNVNLDRIRGSSSIIQPARVIWALDVPDPQTKDKKRLQVIKSNIARFPEPVGMSISELGVVFGAAPEPPKTESLIDKGVDLLMAILDAEPLPQADILKEFQGAGISKATMYRAKDKLGIVSRKDGDGWKWGLPARDN